MLAERTAQCCETARLGRRNSSAAKLVHDGNQAATVIGASFGCGQRGSHGMRAKAVGYYISVHLVHHGPVM